MISWLVTVDDLAKAPLPNDGWPTNDIKLPANAMADPQGALTSVALQAARIAQEKARQLQLDMFKKIFGHSVIKLSAANAKPQAAVPTTTVSVASNTQMNGPADVVFSAQSISVGGIIGDIKNGANKGIDGLKDGGKAIEGTFQKTTDGVEHLVKKASDAAGWVLDQASKSTQQLQFGL